MRLYISKRFDSFGDGDAFLAKAAVPQLEIVSQHGVISPQ